MRNLPPGWVTVHPDPYNPECVRYDYIHNGACVGTVFVTNTGDYDGFDFEPKSEYPPEQYGQRVKEMRDWLAEK